MTQVELKMDWQGCLPIFLALLENGTETGRATAVKELQRAMWLADQFGKQLVIEMYPMTADGSIAQTFEEVAHYDVLVRPDGTDPIDELENATLEEAEAFIGKMQQKYPSALTCRDCEELMQ